MRVDGRLGDQVLYHRVGIEDGEQPMAAFVTKDNEDGTVNVAGFTHYGALFNDHNVSIRFDPTVTEPSNRPHCTYAMHAPDAPPPAAKNGKKAKPEAGKQEE